MCVCGPIVGLCNLLVSLLFTSDKQLHTPPPSTSFSFSWMGYYTTDGDTESNPKLNVSLRMTYTNNSCRRHPPDQRLSSTSRNTKPTFKFYVLQCVHMDLEPWWRMESPHTVEKVGEFVSLLHLLNVCVCLCVYRSLQKVPNTICSQSYTNKHTHAPHILQLLLLFLLLPSTQLAQNKYENFTIPLILFKQ